MSDENLVFDIQYDYHDFDQIHTMAELLCERKLTDCKLMAEGKSINAHRLVLAAASPFFLRTFLMPSPDEIDVNQPAVYIFEEFTYKDLYNVCKFIYTGKLTIDRDDLITFMEVAKSLEVKNIMKLRIDIHKEPKEEPMIEEHLDESLEMNLANVQVKVEAVAEEEPQVPLRKLEVVKAVKRSHVNYDDDEEAVPLKRSKRTRKSRRLNEYVVDEEDEGDENKMSCAFCQKEFINGNTLKNHERFCTLNPNRKISRCPICNEIVKPGSMTFHKKNQHDYVPKSRKRAAPATSSSVPEMNAAVAARPKIEQDAAKAMLTLQVSHAHNKPLRRETTESAAAEEDYDPFESSFEDLI